MGHRDTIVIADGNFSSETIIGNNAIVASREELNVLNFTKVQFMETLFFKGCFKIMNYFVHASFKNMHFFVK